MRDFLYQICQQNQIQLSDKQLEQFQTFYVHLMEKNQVMNLTSITDEREVVIKHFFDSLSMVNYISLKNCHTIIDVGTGAGFPGIPLAILRPDISFTLMDSLQKRILFLEEVIQKCDLHHVSCIHARAEELAQNVNYRAQYDLCVSRAVANMSVLLEYCIPFLKKGGKFISYKSAAIQDELNASRNAQNKLCCKCTNHISFSLPETGDSRELVVFEKFDDTSIKYPRKNGLPRKKPL